MKSEKEIKERQEKFCASYPIRNKEHTPKTKAWDSAIKASISTRHYPVFSKIIEKKEAAIFFWKIELERLGEKYKKQSIDRDRFILDVFELQDSINSSEYKECFANNEIRVGQCQKSLSLFLKWMWCQHQLEYIPPVCPIDRQVLKECYRILVKTNSGTKEEKMNTGIPWSNLNDRELYRRLVDITEKVASLENEPRTCVWELFAFKEPNPK